MNPIVTLTSPDLRRSNGEKKKKRRKIQKSFWVCKTKTQYNWCPLPWCELNWDGSEMSSSIGDGGGRSDSEVLLVGAEDDGGRVRENYEKSGGGGNGKKKRPNEPWNGEVGKSVVYGGLDAIVTSFSLIASISATRHSAGISLHSLSFSPFPSKI